MLASNRPWYTIHYTGGGVWLDPNDSLDELLSIHRYAVGAGKGWEYNYVIDGQGVIGEYAGDYRAAHSSGENDTAIGVLLLVGFAGEYPDDIDYWEQPPTAMIDAARELRAWLEWRGMLAADHDMLQHNQMPGAATACPGDAVKAAWPLLTAPYTPPSEDDMTPEQAQQLTDTLAAANATNMNIWGGPADNPPYSLSIYGRLEAIEIALGIDPWGGQKSGET